jgi:hypothetical protein
VTVTGQNDDDDDGNIVYSIVTAAATSTDGNYNGVDPTDVAVTNVDDDVAGVIVSAPSGPTTEAGGTATFTVVLRSRPTADVAIALSSSDVSEGIVTTPASGSLTFTSDDWNVTRTVTVAGQDDALADDNVAYSIVTGAAASSDPGYSGLAVPDVPLTNVDNETAGVTVSQVSGATTEGGGTATLTVVLNAQPTDPVTIGITSSNTAEGTVSPSSLTFTPSGPGIWNAPQTVTITGQDDAIDDDNVVYTIVTAPATSADPSYNGVNPADVPVTNVDDDAAGVTVSAISGPTTEAGGTATFTVVLTSEPTDGVTIAVASDDTSEGTASPASLTFTPSGAGVWSTPQTVTVTGQDDAIADGNVPYSIVTGTATSSDANYGGFDPVDVPVTNVDDDGSPGIVVSAASGPTSETGGTATFTVVLSTQPSASVTIGLSSSDTSEGTISTSSLTFAPSGPEIWSTPQTVTITGQNDSVDDDNVAYSIVTAPATSSDAAYNGIDPSDISVTNVDDDTAGLTVSAVTGPTTELGGTATFTVVLTSQPLSDVTIAISSDDTSEGTVSPSSLSFTPLGPNIWSTPQTVTVTGQDDLIADGNVAYSIVTGAASSLDPKYSGVDPADVAMTNVDNESAGVTVSAISSPTTEAGGTATFTVALNTQPVADVTITLSSSNTDEGTVAPTSLIFTPSGANIWSNPRTVTVTGQDDNVDDGNVAYTIITAPATSTDPNYGALDPADVSVTNVDDDAAGFTVSPISGPTSEAGGTATFTVRLNSEPTSDVTIAISSADPSEGTAAPSSLTFAPSGPNIWSATQTITVTGQDDAIDDDNVAYSIVTAPASSSDTNYNGLDPADVSVTNLDDADTAGIVVSPTGGLVTTEAGGTAQFDVVLNSEPTADVVIGISSSDTSEGTVSAGSLTFTAAGPGIWNVPRSVTVTGVDDLIVDGDIAYTIVTAAAASSDLKYDGMTVSDVGVTNTDNDVPDFSVTQSGGSTSVDEGGSTDSFTIQLTRAPVGTVTLNLANPGVGNEVGLDSASVTFDGSNWNTPKTVVATGLDDPEGILLVDGVQATQITVSVAAGSDGFWTGGAVADQQFSITTTDDDVPGLELEGFAGQSVSEDLTSFQFRVALSAQPLDTVMVTIVSADTSEVEVTAGATLTFTPANWSTQQFVTLTGVDDAIVDPGGSALITVAVDVASSEPLWAGVSPRSFTVANTDND